MKVWLFRVLAVSTKPAVAAKTMSWIDGYLFPQVLHFLWPRATISIVARTSTWHMRDWKENSSLSQDSCMWESGLASAVLRSRSSSQKLLEAPIMTGLHIYAMHHRCIPASHRISLDLVGGFKKAWDQLMFHPTWDTDPNRMANAFGCHARSPCA